jgi:hypothetical protein
MWSVQANFAFSANGPPLKEFFPISLQILRFRSNHLMALSCSAVDLFDKSLLHGRFSSLKVFQGLASCL